MVTQFPEKKQDADYSLVRVHDLAARQSLRYAGTRVQLDVANLGYGLDDVCACLGSLRAEDFSHSERYVARGKWHDVYKLRWGIGRPLDDLYVKFRLDDDVLVIELCSLHLQR
ncbi:MAG: type II toxin-antitoxin system MqsR family toxin [Xanthomonadales bacterium]|nr:type II toxin-antitoxin system MqsR family toxin [Xanthomonadales bacterium]